MGDKFSWVRGYSRNLILSKIAATRKVNDDRCSFSPAQEYDYWLAVLRSAIRSKDISDLDRRRSIVAALSDASLNLNDPDNFLARCEQTYLALSTTLDSEFVLYTTVTYSGPKLIDSLGDGKSRIVWQPKEGPFLRNAVAARQSLSSKRHHRKIPGDDNLNPLLAFVSARDVLSAFEAGIYAIDRFRGLLNCMMNFQHQLNPFATFSSPHAVNSVRLGPFHTLHRTDGSLATETFWFVPQWMHEAPSAKFEDPKDYGRELRKWWKKLNANPLEAMISDALVKYCRGTDAHLHDELLLGTWRSLERIAGTDNYDLLIDRIIRIFPNPEEIRQVANHLRHRRNASVHSGSGDTREAHVIAYQVEQLARRAIFFCLEYGNKFRDQSGLQEFLDMPFELPRIEERDRISRFFTRYRAQLNN
ncbi:hypothetical protein [Bradyrhizobium sp. JYMT SZCCT0428]|uniref:hypothetical protein n=1 Tax=Bradyrhizobium sp. JYMT SZCCT0428 TaxID=2807673 RepID=UPI001BA5E2F2|nr:hypothetical protein [Bradyrhizobium sp. JYMT SZCCT0428]MBR1155096.1 hypothetical protein [Bradyrhizobium sp. JYMT SZCCT0428]